MDWLRGLAASWVTVFHLNEVIPYHATWWQIICKLGYLGVPIFFVISGWCMAALADRKPHPGRFIGARLVRILLPYWASMLVVLGVVIIRYLWVGHNDVTILPHTAISLIASMFVVTDPVTSLPTINWVYWSLSYELVFYALVAFGLLMKRPALFLLLLLPCTLMAGLQRWDMIEGAPVLYPMFWLNYFPLFCVGYFLCSYRLHGRISALCFALIFAAISFRAETVSVCGTGMITALLLYPRWSQNWMPSIIDKTLTSVGHWSYSLYLIHVPLGVYFFGQFRSERLLTNPFTHVIFDLTNLFFCIFAAAVFHRCVEQPSLRLARLISKQGFVACFRKATPV